MCRSRRLHVFVETSLAPRIPQVEFSRGSGSGGRAFRADPADAASQQNAVSFSPAELFQSGLQRTFSGDQTTQIALPIGGIGAGSICMNGYGGLQDFSIRTRPETTALPRRFSANSPEAAFAVLHLKGESGTTKLVEGPFPAFKIFDQGLQGQGLRRGGFEGFPRFKKCDSKENIRSGKRLSPMHPFRLR